MNQEQLRKKISYSLNEGFTEQEIRQVLREQGVKHSRINQALNKVKGQGNNSNNQENTRGGLQQGGNSQSQFNQQGQASRGQGQTGNTQRNGRQQDNQQSSQAPGSQNSSQGFQGQNQQRSQGGSRDFQSGSQGAQSQQGAQQNQRRGSGFDLADNYYRIKQQLLLTRYSVFDQSDEKILKAKAKILSIKTNIPFLRPDQEEPVFRVVAARFPNVSNNYKVKDEQNDDVMSVLDRKRTLLNQVWRIRDPQDNSIVATIQNESTMLQFLRSYGGMVPIVPNLFALAPHTYSITDVNDNQIGELEGELSIRDEYELNLEDSGQLDRKDMISSIIAIDALEGN